RWRRDAAPTSSQAGHRGCGNIASPPSCPESSLQLILIVTVLVVVACPLLLAMAGAYRTRSEPRASAIAWDAQQTAWSALLYTLAFNLVFFVQELFLVLPKAFTPGLRPTLFHNNHAWEGEHPLAALFQGTGALATFAMGLAILFLLKRGAGRSFGARLLLIWLAYCGVFMALPQVVAGALSSGSDVGMAMDYLALSAQAKSIAALLALAVMPWFAREFCTQLLRLATPAQLASGRTRSLFILRVATLPALAAIALILPFRVPREWMEVLFLPVVVLLAGMPWMQSGAWRLRAVESARLASSPSTALPLLAVGVLLAVFQLVLRPGIAFF
ncbi:MAG: hypothetical protein ABWY48_03880, partial [Pseudoxanthomonas sp.]